MNDQKPHFITPEVRKNHLTRCSKIRMETKYKPATLLKTDRIKAVFL